MMGALEAAEKSQDSSKMTDKHPSGAKAPDF